MTDLVGAIDQGTTSTRFMVFDGSGAVVARAQKEHQQIFPQPGWVEHDPLEIWENTVEVIGAALRSAGLSASDLAAVGVTNQRETTVLWDRHTGQPVANAVVWQDTRTADLCVELGGDDGQDRFRSRTGLPLATYFSGPKARWLLDHHELAGPAARGDILFGTIDTWLTWNLTGAHVTDVTNASRTMLMDLVGTTWDSDLSAEIGIPVHMLPEIRPSVGGIGPCAAPLKGVSLAAILGDQQRLSSARPASAPGRPRTPMARATSC